MIFLLSLGMERGIALDVNPIVRFCGHMTAEAVFLEVGRDLLIRRIGLEKSPTPAITQAMYWSTVLITSESKSSHTNTVLHDVATLTMPSSRLRHTYLMAGQLRQIYW